jgi:large subunit ribosomal protein L11
MSGILRARVKLRVPAGQAKPSPAIGQALGSLGVNMMNFCKEFNDKSIAFRPGLTMRVKMRVYTDGAVEHDVLVPQTSWFLKRAAGVTKGTATPGHGAPMGQIHVKQIYEIAKVKMMDPHMSGDNLRMVCRSLIAQCRCIGLQVVADRRDDTVLREYSADDALLASTPVEAAAMDKRAAAEKEKKAGGGKADGGKAAKAGKK